MSTYRKMIVVWLAVALLISACAPPAPAQSSVADTSPKAPSAPKRIATAVMGVHTTLNSRTIGPGRPPGYDSLEALVSAGLGGPDGLGGWRGQLAEAMPTIENGQWKLLPDGRMETAWTIRANARWHDGQPVTTDDLLFTARVIQDRDLPNFRDSAFNLVEEIVASDPRTLVVRWKQPFIEADGLFTPPRNVPLPRHLLERSYAENKGSFLDLPYWNTEFVGAGAYRVREWTLGSRAVLDADDGYVFGRPKIDVVEVRFITDPSTLLANVLSGEVDVTMGRGLSLEQAADVRERWRAGKVDVAYESWVAIYPQMLNPNPAAILDVEFRRALLQLVDRAELVESIQHGLVPVAHTILNPTEPEYREIAGSLVTYEFDPRRATEGLERLGYNRSGDGGWRDSAGRSLAVEIRATEGDVNEKSMFAVANYWQRAGLTVEPLVIPRARANDREWRNTRPAFELQRQPNALGDLDRYHSSQAALPENNFTGSSKHRYMNPEFDALIDRYFATIPRPERIEVVRQMVHHLSDRVIPLPLFYDANLVLVNDRVRNVGARRGQDSTEAWNVETWDVT
ncbi:MAG: hypothetical protein HW416_943 [Chloroflexi bacterium]|nr:hypothetical protein [Chloroflexota bacterium]